MVLLPVEDLKIGMYVELPISWHEHPFLKSAFVISSSTDIDKIRSMGIREIKVDLMRSVLPRETSPAVGAPSDRTAVVKDEPVVPREFLDCIKNDQLPAEKKAQLVVSHANIMMKNLLEEPTAPRIKEVKEAIGEIVKLILTDEHTTYYLVNLTDHDFSTYTHSVNVGVLGVALAKRLFQGVKEHDLEALGVGFFLHDLGKTKVALEIINKPGRLTDEEMRQMRRHPGEGYRILVETRQITEESRLIVLQHHERMDGTGYPKGLRGDEIHIYGRLCAIADVYDALTSERPYKRKLTPFEALKIMRDEMLNHFQKELFERFVLLFRSPGKAV
ncbi:MAG: HD-GYP domain-containing protein [Syntrophales bacterium]|nr:HD-GYP domain-containing protein [Syntrophales bacterium]